MAIKIKNKSIYKLIMITLFFFIFNFLTGCQQKIHPIIMVPDVQPEPKAIRNIDVALVLGAGGSRSLAHLGVIEVLEENHIPINLIVGSSAGSLIGVLYADTLNAQKLKEKVLFLKRDDLIDLSFRGFVGTPLTLTGPIPGLRLQKFLVDNLSAKKFEDLKIPVIAVATNMDTNCIELIQAGPIAPAINASSALPPFFAPVSLYGHTLVDGGVIAPVPVQIAKSFHPKIVIAVDIGTPPPFHTLGNAFELLNRALHISFYELSLMQSKLADVVIHPDMIGYGTFDDNFNFAMYEAGRVAAFKALPLIKKKLKSHAIKGKYKFD